MLMLVLLLLVSGSILDFLGTHSTVVFKSLLLRVGMGVSGHSKFEQPFVQVSCTSNFETNAAVECALQV